MPADDPPPPTTAIARVDRAAAQRARAVRERVIARLSDGFAHDVLDVDEFERRVTVAQTSDSPDEIQALVADLPAPEGGVEAGANAERALAPTPAVMPHVIAAPAGDAGDLPMKVFAVMGGIERRGSWTVPRKMRLVTMMGGAMLDLREARFPPGVVEIDVLSVMGGVEIIVPPGLAVQVHGSAIMGGFQDVDRAPANPDPDAPLLRVHGLAVMGGVDIQMRLPGESDRDAHRRRRHQLREERRAQRRLKATEDCRPTTDDRRLTVRPTDD